MQHLEIRIDFILVNLHSFFKNSPLRCERYGKFCAMLDEEITTWQKHVSTRWNSILNPCKKLVKNYETISKFILEEMPKLDKKVRSSAVYKNLENFFQPENKEWWVNLLK